MNPDYFDLPLLRSHTVQRRLYQEVIFAASTQKNTLVVLPTGTGKTVVAVVLSAYRLEKAPTSKVVMLAPTRPLVGQHHRRFQQMLLVVPEKLKVITGETPASNRVQFWQKSNLLFMTPQTLRNDIEKKRYDLSEVSLLIFDEAHRASGRYDYVGIADYYVRQAHDPRILALTASPGNIRVLCDALYIENIEVRTEHSPDLLPYLQPVGIKYVIVDLPHEYQKVQKTLKEATQRALLPLIELGLLRPTYLEYLCRRDLLKLRKKLGQILRQGRGAAEPRLYDAMLGIALTLRLSHALEVLQTQGVPQLLRYCTSLENQANLPKAPRNVRLLVTTSWYKETRKVLQALATKGETHPKHPVLIRVITEQLEKEPASRILVFTRFRVSATILTDLLNQQKEIRATRFVGQASRPGDPGLTQREQLTLLDDFRANTYNVLVATNIGEEGLDISECNLVVFYDSVPSAIRRIQRAGRTGRQSPGNLIVLITRGTRDESYHRTSLRKQHTIQKTLIHHARRLRQNPPTDQKNV
ncbi:MAG: DEAD/DEAH box helicase [Promethearchaeota archaeon]